jgi:hypothetical protein
MIEIYDVLHAFPESFSFTNLPNSIDGTVEFGVRTAHTDNLEFSTNDIEWMSK